MKNFASFLIASYITAKPAMFNCEILIFFVLFGTINWYPIVIYSGRNQLCLNIYMTVPLNHRQKTILKGHSCVFCQDMSNKVDV